MNRVKNFHLHALALCLMSVGYTFLYAGLQSDHVSIIQAFVSPAGGGWSAAMTQLPITAGGFACVPLAFVYGLLFQRRGVCKTLVCAVMLSAMGCVALAAAGGLNIHGGAAAGSYWLYFAALFLMRCTCLCMLMAVFALCTGWFIRGRGQVLGIATLGIPLFSTVGTSAMSSFIQTRLGGDYRGFYLGLAVLLGLMALLTRLFLRDRPEDAGLYPNGAAQPPASERRGGPGLTTGQVLKRRQTWLVIVAYGAFLSVSAACMGSMALRFMALGGAEVWLDATKWLALGAILGIPMSYLFGVANDRHGAGAASVLLGLCLFVPVLALWLMPEGGSSWLELFFAFGVACMTGGVPTMQPCAIAHVYGRRGYPAASSVILALETLPAAGAAAGTIRLINGGQAPAAYAVMLAVLALGTAASIPLRRVKNADDPAGQRAN